LALWSGLEEPTTRTISSAVWCRRANQIRRAPSFEKPPAKRWQQAQTEQHPMSRFRCWPRCCRCWRRRC